MKWYCGNFEKHSGGYGSQGTIGANVVTPGELVIDPPTLTNLGFEWVISGDENRNARVEVSYRKKGAGDWKPAMPMPASNGPGLMKRLI